MHLRRCAVKWLSFCIVLFTFALIIGCSDKSTNDDDNLITSNAVGLLGLQQDVELDYVSYDTIVTYYPNYAVYIDTTYTSFSAIATDPSRDQIDLSFDSEKFTAVKITANSVVNLGYFRRINDTDSLFAFSEPSQLFPLKVEKTATWTSFTPSISPYGDVWIGSKLYFSYGFENTRSFERMETVLMFPGSFDCYVFKNEYRVRGTTEPFRTSYEYFSPGFGLVKMYTTGTFGSSHLYMNSRAVLPGN